MKRFLSRVGILTTILIVIAYTFNAFLYAGSGLDSFRWRLSQGRIRFSYSEAYRDHPLSIAIADGRFYFRFDWFWSDISFWSVSIPLWLPLICTVILLLKTRTRRKRETS